MENNSPKTLDELKKAVNSANPPVSDVLLLTYGKTTLHLKPEGFFFDGAIFHQKLAVVREFKPERKKREPKPQTQAAVGAKAKK